MERKRNLKELIDSLGNIGEINLVLSSLEKSPLERWVLNSCILNTSGITTRIPAPDILVDLVVELRLAETLRQRKKEIIRLTDLGSNLFKLKSMWADRLSIQQGRFLYSKIIGKSKLLKDILSVVNILNKDSDESLWISCKDKRITSSEDRVLRLLQQIRLAEFRDNIIFINKENVDWLMDSVSYGIAIDEHTLLKILQKRREHGLLAESYVVQFEKERLRNRGRDNLANLVKRISPINISAGYDVLSFDGITPEETPDRFIEVKGTSTNEVLFFITKNELEQAKKLQDKFWLYCVLNIKHKDLRKLERINNPYKSFMNTDNFELEPVLWKVRMLKNN